MSEKRIDEELAAVEAALSSLMPAASNVQRDRLMFLAGRASMDRLALRGRRGTTWLWSRVLAASLVAMTSLAAILLVMLLAQRGPQGAGHGVGPIVTGPAATAETKTGDADAETRGTLAYASYRSLLQRWLAESERSRKPVDIELPDERLPQGHSFAGDDSATAVGARTGDGQLESYERLPSLQQELDIDRGLAPRQKSQPSDRKEGPS